MKLNSGFFVACPRPQGCGVVLRATQDPCTAPRFILLRLLCCAIWHGGLAQKQCVAELTEEPENRLKQAPIFEVPSDTSMLEFWHPELAGPLQPVRDAATRVCCTRLPRGLRRTLAHYHNF